MNGTRRQLNAKTMVTVLRERLVAGASQVDTFVVEPVERPSEN